MLPSILQVFRALSSDGWLLFVTRSVRMFAYGFLSVVLVLYLKAVGLKEEQIGFLLTMTLVGSVFAVTANFMFLVIAATIGVLSPSDKEVGPFLSIEQAALSQTISDE